MGSAARRVSTRVCHSCPARGSSCHCCAMSACNRCAPARSSGTKNQELDYGRKFAHDTLDFGTALRNTTLASLDQEGFGLATTGAHMQWPPKILLDDLHGRTLQLMLHYGVQGSLHLLEFCKR